MNRIQSWPSKAVPSWEQRKTVRRSLYLGAQRDDLHCTLFAPHHFECNYDYPLLVWLHGPGDDERQLRRVMPHISMRNYVAVGPRGCSDAVPGSEGYRWEQLEGAIASAEQRAFESVTLARRKFPVAPDRVFIAGYQCGGTMALRIALRHPERFAGALSVGGPFPAGLAPLSQLKHVRQLPLFIAQGRDSKQYPLEQACAELRLFHTAAMHVTLRQYPCGDELTTQMLADMDSWLMDQIQGTQEAPGEDVRAYPGDVN
jgi:phospholipase/carboxylesterase